MLSITDLQCSSGIRLMGGSSDNDGRVEFCGQSAWRTVCNNEWDLNDAFVVCKALGKHTGCKLCEEYIYNN